MFVACVRQYFQFALNVSELFRDHALFAKLEKEFIPQLLKRSPKLNIWSAGCSIGAEAYTLAIILDQLTPHAKHRIYGTDLDEEIIKRAAEQVFQVTGRNPKIDIALELERIALEDEYFVKRKLYPNVDFYSGLIYQAMKFPTEMFVVLFAIPRMSGWLSQWQEMLLDPEQKIARPRQIYEGYGQRDFIPMASR